MNVIEIKSKSGTNAIIQRGIDSLYDMGGGTLKIGPGTFILYDSIHLKSGVNIVGSGAQTIFKKCASVSSRLSADLGYGHYDVSVEKPELFKKGLGIYVSDDNGKGFYATVATILWKDKNLLGINRMLNHDYTRVRNARVCSVFPVISGYYARNLTVEGFTIDGNGNENSFIDGCRGGGIFLLQCHNVKIRNIVVRSYNGDGISFQQCTRLEIEDCEITDNFGSGLHPGSGSAGVVMRNCKICRNKKDGVFYCLRVSHTLLEDCIINQNKNDGISIGARDTDHVIKNNAITENARHGIYFRPADEPMGGHRNLVEGNKIVENCLISGEAEVFIEDVNNDQWFTKNYIDGGRSNHGIIAGNKCKGICIAGDNKFCNIKKAAIYFDGRLVNFKDIPAKIRSGPKFLNNKKVRHLAIELG
ncbi:MAG: right-handed parallel beta-helix repeat-containing protein [Candidatus Omnitrophica bacterium]|nr:right-handed parallel beta-helix repeat-containing protein [Candidatus Omnitrophota bacterium]